MKVGEGIGCGSSNGQSERGVEGQDRGAMEESGKRKASFRDLALGISNNDCEMDEQEEKRKIRMNRMMKRR